ncbi:MAG: terminase small subunit [PVC group bacterium]|nr:terminase small subunit [PVC group bacterium]
MATRKKISSRKLTQMELAFCYEYVANKFNGKQAAIAAGYSVKTAEVQASDLLSRPKLKLKVKQLTDKYLKKVEYTGESILNELAILGFSDMNDMLNEDENGDLTLKSLKDMGYNTRCIQQLEITNTTRSFKDSTETQTDQKIKFKLYDKRATLELIGKNLQLFTDRIHHTGEVNNTVQVYIPDNGRNNKD